MLAVCNNGRPHGPLQGCNNRQLHMRSFKDGETIVEPRRSAAFPVIKDFVTVHHSTESWLLVVCVGEYRKCRRMQTAF